MRRNNERTRLEIKAKNITAGNYSILVKNLPYNATVAEIVAFFSPYAPPSQPAASPRDSLGCD
jgi:RNA recognition motif-containing protein